MERAISVIKDFGLSKDQIDQFVSQVLNDIHNHDGDVLSTAICLSAMESVIKKIRAGIKELIILESDKYQEKTFDYQGAVITKASRATYDFTKTDKWNELSEAKKELEKVMKSITRPMADADTGEIIYPAQKNISESISIKIK